MAPHSASLVTERYAQSDRSSEPEASRQKSHTESDEIIRTFLQPHESSVISLKKKTDREALWKALNDDRIDVLATDHAPHTLEEKQQVYTKAPSGGPLVQHALPAMLTAVKQGKIKFEKLVQKACHNPAILFNIEKRGFLKEGYFADLVLVDLEKKNTVIKSDLLYQANF